MKRLSREQSDAGLTDGGVMSLAAVTLRLKFSHCDRDSTIHDTQNIYYLGTYGKSLPTSAVMDG